MSKQPNPAKLSDGELGSAVLRAIDPGLAFRVTLSGKLEKFNNAVPGWEQVTCPLEDPALALRLFQEHRISTTCDSSGVWIAYCAYNYVDEQRCMASGSTLLEAGYRCLLKVLSVHKA